MTQHTPEALLDALKMMLRERKLSYSVIARAIDVSLPTIKRLLNKPTIPLSRLMEICEPNRCGRSTPFLHRNRTSYSFDAPSFDRIFSNF